MFEKFGRLYEMRSMMDYSNQNLHYCFVCYTTEEDAKVTIQVRLCSGQPNLGGTGVIRKMPPFCRKPTEGSRSEESFFPEMVCDAQPYRRWVLITEDSHLWIFRTLVWHCGSRSKLLRAVCACGIGRSKSSGWIRRNRWTTPEGMKYGRCLCGTWTWWSTQRICITCSSGWYPDKTLKYPGCS